jgi:hypothetical protein
VVWEDNGNAMGTRPATLPLTLYADGQPYATYLMTNGNALGELLWLYTFPDVPTMQSGQKISYTVGAPSLPQYAAAATGNTLVLTQTVNICFTATWADSSDADGLRPAALTLRLMGNGHDAARTVAMTGAGDTWSASFEKLPVWSTTNPIKQIIYTYRVDTTDTANYSIDYRGYAQDSSSSGLDTLRYSMTLTHTATTGGGNGGGSGGGGSSGGGSSGGGSGTTSGGSSGGNSAGGSSTVQDKNVIAYIKGYPDGSVRPDGAIARCEVVAIIARVSEDYDPGKQYVSTFSDVPAGAWYANYLGYCVQAGVITGYRDGTFRPMAAIDRGEFAAIAARFLGLGNEGSTAQFSDVDSTYWAMGYISQLAERKIIDGDGKGRYLPTASISRAEAVKIVNGILDRRPATDADRLTLTELQATRGGFTDLDPKHWAYFELLEAAYEHEHK